MTSPVRVRSTFSFGRGVSHVETLAKAAKSLGHDRIGLADRNSVAGHVRFAKSCGQEGLIPLFGAEIKIGLGGPNARAEPPHTGWVTAFIRSRAGAGNLHRLLRKVPLGGDEAIPLPALLDAQDGLLLLTGNGSDGLLPRMAAHDPRPAARLACELREAFGDRAYVEIERHGEHGGRDATEASLLAIAMSSSNPMPMIATTPVWYATPDGRDAWGLSRAIALNKITTLRRDGTLDVPNLPETSSALPAPADLSALFADIPEALRNASDIFERCAWAPPLRPPSLPSLRLDGTTPEEALRRACREGLRRRLEEFVACAPHADYEARLAQELEIIERTGFPSYFLVVAEFVAWAKARDIPVGPGRGSGVGSLAAWALGITEVDPLRHGLLFERFLNPERVSLPDFDIDFCERRREEVLAHVTETYGEDRVGAISTFSEIRIKTAIKDVARILIHEDGNTLPFSEVNAITKLIPSGPKEPKDLDEALKTIPELNAAVEKDARVAATFRLAGTITGLLRHAGTHAAGVVIADSPLIDTAPLHPATGRKAGQLPQIGFDMADCEALGLVKFDFLGLSTTTLLRDAERMLAELGGARPDWARMDLDDPAVIDAFARGDTFGVFQFESAGMRRALQEVKPTRFSDLVAINALFRPGPIKYIQEFARRKTGDVEIAYPPPRERTRPILEETCGIMVYQEQVMRIAQVCAGYSLGAADVLRRAMGKKKPSEMEAQRRIFLHGDGKDIPGALALGLSPEEANRLFDDMETFAGYGFNKSHAVAYSLLAWRCMWFRINHPEAFHCALLNAKKDDIEEIGRISRELTTLGIPLLNPDIELSGAEFRVEAKEGRLAIRFGLDGVRNVGDAGGFVRAREGLASRNLASLADLTARIFTGRQIESLAAAGAFDRWTRNRRQAFEGMLARKTTLLNGEQASLLPETGRSWEEMLPPALAALPDWEDRRDREHVATGAVFGVHPIIANKDLLFRYGVRRLSSWLDGIRRKGLTTLRNAKLAIMVERCEIASNRNNARILKIVGNEVSGRYEVLFYDAKSNMNIEHLKMLAETSQQLGEPLVVIADLSFDPRTDTPNLRGAGLATMLDVAMAIPGWFVAITPAGLRIPEPLPESRAAPRRDASHRLLILTEDNQGEAREIFPADRSFLSAIMSMRDVRFRRMTEEEYRNLLNAESAPNKPMAAA